MSKFNNNGSCDVIEIIERDSSLRKNGSWRFNVDDKKLANSILAYIIRKYNFNPAMPKEDLKNPVIDLDVSW